MKIENKLKLLDLAKNFQIHKTEHGYRVDYEDANLSMSIEDDEIIYYATGIYNSGCDAVEIDIRCLNELIDFAKILMEEK